MFAVASINQPAPTAATDYHPSFGRVGASQVRRRAASAAVAPSNRPLKVEGAVTGPALPLLQQ